MLKHIMIKIEFQVLPTGYFNINLLDANICKTFDINCY